MSEIDSIEKAIRRAKTFLSEAGASLTFCILMEAPKVERGKWIVKFEDTLRGEVYTVTIAASNGNIEGFERKKQ